MQKSLSPYKEDRKRLILRVQIRNPIVVAGWMILRKGLKLVKTANNFVKGSIILETVIVLPILLFTVLLNLELVQRAKWEVVLQHGAFLFVRTRVLGGSHQMAKAQLSNFLTQALGEGKARKFMLNLRLLEQWDPSKLTVKFQHRYRTLLKFPMGNETKHHYEVTRECHFPLSF